MYTNNGATAPIASVYGNVSPYIDGSYFTGQMPPFNHWFNPYTAVIDLDDMTVIAKDTFFSQLGTAGVMNAVNQAASN